TARRTMAAMTPAMTRIRNSAATRPKPRWRAGTKSGRIVDVDLLNKADGFAVPTQGQAQRHQALAGMAAGLVGELAGGDGIGQRRAAAGRLGQIQGVEGFAPQHARLTAIAQRLARQVQATLRRRPGEAKGADILQRQLTRAVIPGEGRALRG